MVQKAIINPQEVVNNKIITGLIDEKNQVQQNGVDLTVSMLFEVHTDEQCVLTEKERVKPKSSQIKLVYDDDFGEVYKLKAGKLYDVLFSERIALPNDKSGMIIQRSSMNRMWAFVTTGWWDSGFKNRIGAIIRPSIDILLGKDVRIAQFVTFDSDAASLYDGVYNEKTK